MKTLCGMTMLGLLLWGTVAVCLGQDVKPQVNDGHALLRQCRTGLWLVEQRRAGRNPQLSLEEASDAWYCLGLIEGSLMTSVAYDVSAPAGKGAGPLFCPPAGADRITPERVARAIVRFLEDRPAERAARGSIAGVMALPIAFPCPPPPTRSPR